MIRYDPIWPLYTGPSSITWPNSKAAQNKIDKSSAIAEMAVQCCTIEIFVFLSGGAYV